jgi:hypothetical protein
MTRILCAVLLSMAMALPAFAHRAAVPLYDFKAVPVAAPTTIKRVKAAIVNATLAHWWDIAETSDGTFLVTFAREGEYTATVRITYDAAQYSITYVGSTNLRHAPSGNFGQIFASPKSHEDAERRQIEMFKSSADTPYAVKTEAYIHPTYEVLVRELLAGIRRQLLAPTLLSPE